MPTCTTLVGSEDAVQSAEDRWGSLMRGFRATSTHAAPRFASTVSATTLSTALASRLAAGGGCATASFASSEAAGKSGRHGTAWGEDTSWE